MSSFPDAGTIGQGSVAIGMAERLLAWLVGCQGLQVRYERRADSSWGFVYLACALTCRNFLNLPEEDGRRLLA